MLEGTNMNHSPLFPFGDAVVPWVVTCAFDSPTRLYLTLT